MEDKLKLIESISEIFPFYDEDVAMPKKAFMVLDPVNVCAIYGRDEEMKRLLMKFVQEDGGNIKTDKKLDYSGKGEIGCMFGIEYLSKVFSVFKEIDDTVTIFCKKDYPIKIESKSLGFILAPRVESNEDEKNG